MSALCVIAGAAMVRLAAESFTLAWTHTIEKQPWEEDWRVAGDELVLVEWRVAGSGAGMEPDAGAVFEGGMWRARPRDRRERELVLRRAPEAGDWRLCLPGAPCRPLGAIVGADADPVRLKPC